MFLTIFEVIKRKIIYFLKRIPISVIIKKKTIYLFILYKLFNNMHLRIYV